MTATIVDKFVTVFDFETRGERKYRSEIDQAKASMRGLGDVADGVKGRLLGLFAGIGVSAGILKLGKDIITVSSSFESLGKSLEVVTGSADAAQNVLSQIKAFAVETPQQVGDITKQYIRLRSVGIEPTMDLLREFGDLAVTLGSPEMDPSQRAVMFTEAVVDAAQGEFERLKEFAIRASKDKDQITLTYNGISRTVKSTSQDIANAFRQISKENFAGAMSSSMDTAAGKISNLKDAYDAFVASIGDEGVMAEWKLLLEDVGELIGDDNNGLVQAIGSFMTDALHNIRDIIQEIKGEDIAAAFRTAERVIKDLIRTGSELAKIFMAIYDAIGGASGLVAGFVILKGATLAYQVGMASATSANIAFQASLGGIGLIIAGVTAALSGYIWSLGQIEDKIQGIQQSHQDFRRELQEQLGEGEGEEGRKIQSMSIDELLDYRKNIDARMGADKEEIARQKKIQKEGGVFEMRPNFKGDVTVLTRISTAEDAAIVEQEHKERIENLRVVRDAVKRRLAELSGEKRSSDLEMLRKEREAFSELEKSDEIARKQARFKALNAKQMSGELLPSEQDELNKLSKELDVNVTRKTAKEKKEDLGPLASSFTAYADQQAQQEAERVARTAYLGGASMADADAQAKAARDATKKRVLEQLSSGSFSRTPEVASMLRQAGFQDLAAQHQAPVITVQIFGPFHVSPTINIDGKFEGTAERVADVVMDRFFDDALGRRIALSESVLATRQVR